MRMENILGLAHIAVLLGTARSIVGACTWPRYVEGNEAWQIKSMWEKTKNGVNWARLRSNGRVEIFPEHPLLVASLDDK